MQLPGRAPYRMFRGLLGSGGDEVVNGATHLGKGCPAFYSDRVFSFRKPLRRRVPVHQRRPRREWVTRPTSPAPCFVLFGTLPRRSLAASTFDASCGRFRKFCVPHQKKGPSLLLPNPELSFVSCRPPLWLDSARELAAMSGAVNQVARYQQGRIVPTTVHRSPRNLTMQHGEDCQCTTAATCGLSAGATVGPVALARFFREFR